MKKTKLLTKLTVPLLAAAILLTGILLPELLLKLRREQVLNAEASVETVELRPYGESMETARALLKSTASVLFYEDGAELVPPETLPGDEKVWYRNGREKALQTMRSLDLPYADDPRFVQVTEQAALNSADGWLGGLYLEYLDTQADGFYAFFFEPDTGLPALVSLYSADAAPVDPEEFSAQLTKLYESKGFLFTKEDPSGMMTGTEFRDSVLSEDGSFRLQFEYSPAGTGGGVYKMTLEVSEETAAAAGP